MTEIVVPRDLTVKKLSDTVIVPTLWKFLEKDTKESIARGPELRDWVTDKLLVGDERLESMKAYERQKERLQYFEDYRLGKDRCVPMATEG